MQAYLELVNVENRDAVRSAMQSAQVATLEEILVLLLPNSKPKSSSV